MRDALADPRVALALATAAGLALSLRVETRVELPRLEGLAVDWRPDAFRLRCELGEATRVREGEGTPEVLVSAGPWEGSWWPRRAQASQELPLALARGDLEVVAPQTLPDPPEQPRLLEAPPAGLRLLEARVDPLPLLPQGLVDLHRLRLLVPFAVPPLATEPLGWPAGGHGFAAPPPELAGEDLFLGVLLRAPARPESLEVVTSRGERLPLASPLRTGQGVTLVSWPAAAREAWGDPVQLVRRPEAAEPGSLRAAWLGVGGQGRGELGDVDVLLALLETPTARVVLDPAGAPEEVLEEVVRWRQVLRERLATRRLPEDPVARRRLIDRGLAWNERLHLVARLLPEDSGVLGGPLALRPLLGQLRRNLDFYPVESTLGSAPVREAFCALLRDASCADGPADPENLALRSWSQISYQVPVRFDGSVWFQYLPSAIEALLRLEPGGTWSGDELAARIRQFVLLLLRGRGPDGERPLVQGLPEGRELLEALRGKLRGLPPTPARARELARCEALMGPAP